MRDSRRKDIRRKANQIRQNCRTSKYGIINLFKECDSLGYKLIRYPLGEEADLGFAMIKDRDIIIYTNSSVRLSREIFTLAHEIGHAVLHMAEARTFIDNSNTISDYSADEREQEANYFAACLLMPDDEVFRFIDLELEGGGKERLTAIDIAKIMSEFNASFEMVLNRLESIGKIDAVEKAVLDNERNEKRVGNLLRSAGGNATLNEASRVTDIPYEYIEYVIYNYNRGAIPKETLLKALGCYNLTLEDVSDKIIEPQEDEEDEDDDLAELIGGLPD